MKKIIVSLILLFVLILITGCGNKKESIVIYSSMEDNRNQELSKQLKKEFPNLNVKVQYISTGNHAAKIKSEGSNVEADIFLDLETAYSESLKDNFADLTEYDQSMYLEGVNPKHNKYFTWVKSYASIIIDKDYFNKNNLEKPKTYEDLLNPEYKGLIAMPDPKTSGTGFAFYLNVMNEMGEKQGIKYFEKLQENIKQFTTSGSGPMNLLQQGEIAIAMGMTFLGVESINNGANYEIIELETGSPYTTTAFGIIKGKENNKNVQEVFEWLLNSFLKYDVENFLPGKILKEQETKIKNYPSDLKDADMTGIESFDVKDKLLDKWEY